MSLIQEFFNELIKGLVEEDAISDVYQNVVKQHTDKLGQNGDLGFPLLAKAWLPVVRDASRIVKSEKLFEENDAAYIDALVQRSEKWSLQIERAFCSADRCVLFIRRKECFAKVMQTVLADGRDYGKSGKELGKLLAIDSDASNAEGLTQYRCALVKSVLTNLIEYSKYAIGKDGGENVLNVIVCHPKSRQIKDGSILEWNNNHSGYMKKQLVICGPITHGSRGDMISAEDFIRKQSDDMEKIAQMKYGDDTNEMVLYDFTKLGQAVAIFELLKVKHGSPIPIGNAMRQSCSAKGAVFVLYNVARVQRVLITFNEKVADGYYAPLPEFDQIDVSLLREEEEWQLLYVYILGFPPLLQRCIRTLECGQLAIHSLCTFLTGFTSLFSVYYHRVKILTSNQPQLRATMNARIYLLLCIRQVLTTSLNLLNIEPLDQM